MMRSAQRLGAIGALLLAMTVVSALAGAPAALADTGDSITPADSHGIPITDYLFGFSYGAGVFGVAATPTTTIPAAFAVIMFGAWIAGWWIAGSIFNLFLSMDWLTPIVRVAESVSTSISDQFGDQFVFSVVGATMLLTITVFALRNQAGRAWHHVALTIVCMGVGVVMVLPVGEAAHLLKMGRDIAAETGSSITGHPAGTTPSAALMDEFVRKPTQRWQYGRDMDSLGCGKAWDDKLAEGDPDKMKDAPLACPGGDLGAQMHAHAMNPAKALTSSFLYPTFMAVVVVLVLMIVKNMGSTAVGAVLHAALIKPGLIAIGTSIGQRFLVRNVTDGFSAAFVFGGYLLMLFVSAALVGILSAAVPPTDVGMLMTVLVMCFTVGGVHYARENLRNLKNAVGQAVLPAGSPSMYNEPSRAPAMARQAALHAAHAAASEVRNRRRISKALAAKTATKAASDLVAPEFAIPAQVINSFAHEVLRTAHQYRTVHHGGSGVGGSYTGGGVAGGGRGGSRSVNYAGSGTSGSGGAANARQLARRSSQRRAQARAAESAAAGPNRGNQAVQRPPAMPAPLRGGGGARQNSGSGGSLASQGPSPTSSAMSDYRGAAPGRVAGGGRVGPSQGSSSSSTPRAGGANQTLRRAGTVNAARSAARNFRRGRQ